MMAHLRANLWLLVLTVLICSVLYPLALLGIGQAVFRDKAQGSLLKDAQGNTVGSRLIAQPFTGDEYFQPRPSATTPSYNAAASTGSNWAASNYQLRDRVARQLGPIIKYKGTPPHGKTVQDDLTEWFQKDQFGGQPGIVAQWADAHSTLAQNWVKADKLNAEYVTAWQSAHKDEVDEWIKKNPETPEPKPEDLAVVFFMSFSKTYPGAFLDTVEVKAPDGQTEKRIEPVREGTAIQGTFFDMWLQEHPDVALESVPADMVMASGSGLDPDITLKNAQYQLDRVASKWAELTGRDKAQVQKEIDGMLGEKAEAPFGGLAGVKLVNVLEMNLALRDRYEKDRKAGP
jgi:potassium-transporting ATPase KdpC subunit